jgi:hypothetical protein
MRWHDNAPYDFSLVSTYFPVLVLVARGTFCVVLMNWITTTLGLELQTVCMVTVCFVYIDSILMHDNNFDRACGHLCMCALAILTQQQGRVCSSTESVLVIVCDLLWSACAGVEVILRTTGGRMQGKQLNKIVLSCAFACTRVGLSCNALGFVQSIFRTWLYYVLCSLLLLCSTFLPHNDSLLHSSSVVYICAHVFFVHIYAVIASVVVIVCVHGRLVYLHVAHDDVVNKHTSAYKQNGAHKQDSAHSKHESTQKHESVQKHESLQKNDHTNTTSNVFGKNSLSDHSELIMMLQAAKRANNVV